MTSKYISLQPKTNADDGRHYVLSYYDGDFMELHDIKFKEEELVRLKVAIVKALTPNPKLSKPKLSNQERCLIRIRYNQIRDRILRQKPFDGFVLLKGQDLFTDLASEQIDDEINQVLIDNFIDWYIKEFNKGE